MRRLSLLFVTLLGICLFISGCTLYKDTPRVDMNDNKVENNTVAGEVFSDQNKLNTNGYLLWLANEYSKDEDGSNMYSRGVYIYSFDDKRLFRYPISNDDPMYLIQSNYPKGGIAVSHSGNEKFTFWSITNDKGLIKEKTVKVMNGSEIKALYDGIVYYHDKSAYYNMESLKNGDKMVYDESIFEDIIVSENRELLFFNRLIHDVAVSKTGGLLFINETSIEYEENGQRYENRSYELCFAEPDNACTKLLLSEDCLIESRLCVQGIWIDKKQAYLALPIQTNGIVEMILHKYMVDTNQLIRCYTQDGEPIILSTGKHSVVDGSVTVSPDGSFLAYMVYDWGEDAIKKEMSFALKEGTEKKHIIVVSLNTGEKFEISNFLPKESVAINAYAPLLWLD